MSIVLVYILLTVTYDETEELLERTLEVLCIVESHTLYNWSNVPADQDSWQCIVPQN